jgi:hypothetical protein
MWLVTSVESRSTELDFRSSGQGRRADAALFAGGNRLVNAAGLIEYDPTSDRVQVEICEDCGFTHCAPGGWVSLRRLDDNVLWLPAFAAMSDGGPTGEYRPPHYFTQRGVPFLNAATYLEVIRHVPVFPAIADIHPLSVQEAVLVLQWEAPGRILGTFPEAPQLRNDLIFAVDYGDRQLQVAALTHLLAESWAQNTRAVLREDMQQRSFFLQLPGHPVWSPIAGDDDEWGLSLAPSLSVAPPRASA